MYLFGSALIKKYFPDFRQSKDLDYLSNKPVPVSNDKHVEYYCIPFAPDRELTSHELYTLKVSHAIYDIHWQKTMSDIRFLQIKGCRVDEKFLADLRAFWLTVHTHKKYTRVSFDGNPEDFFNDKVERKIEHDKLHLFINPQPAYLRMVEGIKPIEDKFLLLAEEEKRKTVLEEAYVIGIERFYYTSYLDAYLKAQNALITRLHPIWLADYIIERWNQFFVAPRDYKIIFERLKNGL